MKKNVLISGLFATALISAGLAIKNIKENKQKNNAMLNDPILKIALGNKAVEKNKVKIELENLEEDIKEINLRLKIEGNAKFKKETIKMLIEGDSIKKEVKISKDRTIMNICMQSNEALNLNKDILSICEVKLKKSLKDRKSGYKIDANITTHKDSFIVPLMDTMTSVSNVA